MKSWLSWFASGAFLVGLSFGHGCGGSATPKPGAMCVLSSGCINPLSCTYGRCHVGCVDSRDCKDDGRCIKSMEGGAVCLLPDEDKCTLTSECKNPLVCGRDLKCRNQCREDRDCPTRTQKCTTDGNVCAEPTELNEAGRLKNAIGVAPAGGAGGSADGGAAAGAGGGAAAGAGGAGGGAAAGAGGAMMSSPDAGRDVPAGGTSGAGGSSSIIDYALAAQREEWLRHPALGDPSCDNFERIGGSVVNGKPGLEWPVNGSLAVDPADGAWYLFAGLYPKDYALLPPPNHMQCAIHRSRDQGKTWDALGAPWPESAFKLDGVRAEVTHAPDMAATFADGRWHLIYDWVSADATWATVNAPPPTGSGADSGVGYASAASPGGPWTRALKPLRLNSQVFRAPLLGKYHRVYASTLLRREHDWLLLSAMDSSPAFSWALVGATAQRPEGPYGEAVPLLHTEDARYMPAILEFFPSFAHDGIAYAPATGLALNRNHQVLFAAKLEEAHRPEAWRIEQEGAIWHSVDTPNEARGLWGQTLGATVFKGDLLTLFPTRDRAGLGHLGVARRPWAEPFRDGLVLSGHEASAPAPLRWSYDAFRLDAKLVPRGPVALLWAWSPAVGYNAPADWKPHAQSLRRCQMLELDDAAWRVVVIDAQGMRQVVAQGRRNVGATELLIERSADGVTAITLAGQPIWRGSLPAGGGALGLFTGEWSHLGVGRLAVSGERRPATVWYVPEDSFFGAGGNQDQWQITPHAAFHFGKALVHRGNGGRAKWSVRASALNLWAPRGPDGVSYTVELDGRDVATIECRAPQEIASAPVWKSGPLPYGPHTVVLRAVRGPLVVDSLEVTAR